MDILGAVLGRKKTKSRSATSVVTDILFGGKKSAPAPKPSSTTRRSRAPQKPPAHYRSEDVLTMEEILAEADGYHNYQRTSRQSSGGRSSRNEPAQPSRQPTEYQPRFEPSPKHSQMNEQAKILLRAMINAAKSDGQIDQKEQDEIVSQIDHLTEQEINFLKSEFSKPLDVREFAWSVPIGMEESVYSASLVSIDLDENKEAKYLAELAHGLRLTPDVCNRIHRKFHAPEIFE